MICLKSIDGSEDQSMLKKHRLVLPTINHRREPLIGLETYFLLAKHRLVSILISVLLCKQTKERSIPVTVRTHLLFTCLIGMRVIDGKGYKGKINVTKPKYINSLGEMVNTADSKSVSLGFIGSSPIVSKDLVCLKVLESKIELNHMKNI